VFAVPPVTTSSAAPAVFHSSSSLTCLQALVALGLPVGSPCVTLDGLERVGLPLKHNGVCIAWQVGTLARQQHAAPAQALHLGGGGWDDVLRQQAALPG